MNYELRRQKLMELLPDYSIAVLYSGVAPYSIGDEKYPFKVERSFHYFTGLTEENMYLVLVKLSEEDSRVLLFIEPYDETMAKWIGGRILPQQASEISKIKNVCYVDELEDTLFRYINSYGKLQQFILCGDLSKQELSQQNKVADLFNKLKGQMPDLSIMNIFHEICSLRMNKDAEEIALMRQAIAVTKEGIETMMSYAHENIWENELEAYFDFVLKCHQCDHAFATICATGKNATVLHYSENNQYAKTDDLVLCDLGAAYKLYNADITRTFPVNGKFTERQKQIYDIVLRANKMVEQTARPGLTTKQLNQKVIEFYEVELKKIGLLENGKTVRDYYWHGVSHMIGLETHDISMIDLPLQVGCVISDEPGLYLEEEGIGIRIEDDLLITENGCECLSKDIIKEIADIEQFMSKYKQ
ncbi:MAG: Xaa-Pro aminopeptidase [Erysipelotrichia bacterium]|nr:Xaa-Pro aminopeptidase [Erysipelotrichia bacterium]